MPIYDFQKAELLVLFSCLFKYTSKYSMFSTVAVISSILCTYYIALQGFGFYELIYKALKYIHENPIPINTH